MPGTLSFIQIWVLNGRTTYRSPEEQAAVAKLVAQNLKYVYMLEMTKRFDSNTHSMEEIATLTGQAFALSEEDDFPISLWDDRLQILSIPSLIQSGQWYERHGWLDIYLAGEVFERDYTGKSDFDRLIEIFDPLKTTGYGHIGVYPLLTTNFESVPFVSIPKLAFQSFLLKFGMKLEA